MNIIAELLFMGIYLWYNYIYMHSVALQLHYNSDAKTAVHSQLSYPGPLYVWLTCDGKVAEAVDIMLGDPPRLALFGEELEETRDKKEEAEKEEMPTLLQL